MKIIPFIFMISITSSVFAFEKAPSLNFQSVNVSQVINLVYSDALKQPYVIDPSLLDDKRMVSFRFDSSKGDFKQFWNNFLNSLGFTLTSKNGVDFVTVRKEEMATPQDSDIFIYTPKYRTVSYIVDLTSKLFKDGSFSVQRSIKTNPNDPVPSNAPAGSAASLINTNSEVMIFQGSASNIKFLKSVLDKVDTRTNDVMVNAVIYEVQLSNNKDTAFSLALKAFGSSVGVNIGQGSTANQTNSIGITGTNFQMAFTALAADSHFKTISTPHVRVQSGSKATLQVGQDVPTLGAVTYTQNGTTPVQSVVYQSSGVIFDLTPTVHDKIIDLNVNQQVSDFAQTTSGVNNSPTLIKRSLSTTVSLKDGELIMIGGLTQQKSLDSTSGLSFLPNFMRGHSNSDSRTELILLMQIDKINH